MGRLPGASQPLAAAARRGDGHRQGPRPKGGAPSAAQAAQLQGADARRRWAGGRLLHANRPGAPCRRSGCTPALARRSRSPSWRRTTPRCGAVVHMAEVTVLSEDSRRPLTPPKVWAHPPHEMNSIWVGERVATIRFEDILSNVIQRKDAPAWGPNAQFRYPMNGTGHIWEKVFSDLPKENTRLNARVAAVRTKKGAKALELADGTKAPAPSPSLPSPRLPPRRSPSQDAASGPERRRCRSTACCRRCRCRCCSARCPMSRTSRRWRTATTAPPTTRASSTRRATCLAWASRGTRSRRRSTACTGSTSRRTSTSFTASRSPPRPPALPAGEGRWP